MDVKKKKMEVGGRGRWGIKLEYESAKKEEEDPPIRPTGHHQNSISFSRPPQKKKRKPSVLSQPTTSNNNQKPKQSSYAAAIIRKNAPSNRMYEHRLGSMDPGAFDDINDKSKRNVIRQAIVS